jgi:hypothetical protein
MEPGHDRVRRRVFVLAVTEMRILLAELPVGCNEWLIRLVIRPKVKYKFHSSPCFCHKCSGSSYSINSQESTLSDHNISPGL